MRTNYVIINKERQCDQQSVPPVEQILPWPAPCTPRYKKCVSPPCGGGGGGGGGMLNVIMMRQISIYVTGRTWPLVAPAQHVTSELLSTQSTNNIVVIDSIFLIWSHFTPRPGAPSS